jgi:hypothetical protein
VDIIDSDADIDVLFTDTGLGKDDSGAASNSV